jgi:single-strand DNA-binding protein
MSLVNVSIVGNVTRQPEYFEFQNGKQKTTITVAIKSASQARTGDDRWETEFYRVETWGKLAEISAKYLSKGSHIGASGRLVLDKWQDKTGRDRVTPVVKADQISLPPRLQVVQAQEAITGGTPPAKEPTLAAEECSEDEYDESLGFVMREEITAVPPPQAPNAMAR